MKFRPNFLQISLACCFVGFINFYLSHNITYQKNGLNKAKKVAP